MTALPSRHYRGHNKATQEEGNPETHKKGIWTRNMDCGLQVELKRDGGGNVRQSWMESSGLWPVFHWEQQCISQGKTNILNSE